MTDFADNILTFARKFPRLLLLVSVCLCVGVGCIATDPSRPVVTDLRFRGVRQVSIDELRSRIATRETPRWAGITWPWMERHYYDVTSFRRDLERIERFYRAQGYYSAAVQTADLTFHRPTPTDNRVEIDLTVREGTPTTVGTIWISGCDRGFDSELPPTEQILSPDTCNQIRRRLRLQPGSTFTESGFNGDQSLIVGLMRDEGYALAKIYARSMVDPAGHRAHLVYVLNPGVRATFGRLRFSERNNEYIESGTLPSGIPVETALRAIRLRSGQPFRQTTLAETQRQLFAIGVFGIVRICERPFWVDRNNPQNREEILELGGSNRCASEPPDPTHPPTSRLSNDANRELSIDIEISLTTVRSFRWRFGGGVGGDQTRGNAHLAAEFEWRYIRMGNRLARLRLEARPQALLALSPLTISGGGIATIDFRVPAILNSTTLVSSLTFEYGPDPVNPAHVSRLAARTGIGLQYALSRDISLGLSARFVALAYTDHDPLLEVDPLFREQYRFIGRDPQPQFYGYLDGLFTFDRRDDPLNPRSGIYALIATQVGRGDRFFFRTLGDIRGFIPLHRNITLAARGSLGLAVGLDNQPGWPVPQELRFYSGGATSNRGYPFGRVGYATTVPQQTCQLGSVTLFANECSRSDTNLPFALFPQPAQPDITRFTQIGGLTSWELSIELRFYFGSIGFVTFFDASDVRGWSPPDPPAAQFPGQPVYSVPQRPAVITDLSSVVLPETRSANQPVFGITEPDLLAPERSRLSIHPTVGVGLRYLSPIGVIRFDLGLRLDELDCITTRQSIYNRDLSSAGPSPWYYVVSRPACDFLGALPVAWHLAIGEAF